jgi:hypothetical protein
VLDCVRTLALRSDSEGTMRKIRRKPIAGSSRMVPIETRRA